MVYRFARVVRNSVTLDVEGLDWFDNSEGVPPGTHLLEVTALGYFFPPVSKL